MSTTSLYSPEVYSEFAGALEDRVLFNHELAPYVAYQIGGPSDILVFPQTERDLLSVWTLAKKFHLPVTIIGTGTNLLVDDEGIRGVTMHFKNSFKEIKILREEKDTVLIECGGGTLKPDLLEWAIQKGFTGLEFSSGVPGTIGGGIFMNAGTKYGSYGDILREVLFFSFETGKPLRVKTHSENFGYRHQSLVSKETLVVNTVMELKRGNSETIRTEVNRIIQERAEKQPLDFPSCGSTFKNPPGYSAGRLIEKAGLKGLCVGGAEISLKHANFILNKNRATSRDIQTLIKIIQKRVWEAFQVPLECEVILLGGNNNRENPDQNQTLF